MFRKPIARPEKTAWLAGLLLLAALLAPAALAAPNRGALSGVVVDPGGVPQMGATIWLLSEEARGPADVQLLSDQKGSFFRPGLAPGYYTLRVTLVGFLPAIQRHIQVEANLTTVVQVALDSLFSSFDRLRRTPRTPPDNDDWTWILRTSAGTRPILRWGQGEVTAPGEESAKETARQRKAHGRVELTSGARRPGSASNLADAPATAFAYEQSLGGIGRLLLAGQASYERAAASGFAAVWQPSGQLAFAPQSTLVLRQTKLGPGGPTFRGARLDHSDQVALGDRITVRFGAEYILVSLTRSASSLRPRGEIGFRFSPDWQASVLFSTRPWAGAGLPPNTLESALQELDSFPTVLVRNGRPVLEGSWHQEAAVERRLGPNASLVAALFRDRAAHTAVFGRGGVGGGEFLQDAFSDAFVYDGGDAASWGTRLAYRQKLAGDVTATVVYSWAGALVLAGDPAGMELRDALRAQARHSLAARVSTRIPRMATQVAASYKWIQGPVVSRHDSFGEITYQLDPYFNLTVRQPLPTLLLPGRLEALADFRNLLAQGYVPVNTRDGQLVLVPSQRSIRGGLSFQF